MPSASKPSPAAAATRLTRKRPRVSHVAALQGVDEQRAFGAELRVRHGRKRNLMKLLG